MAAGIRSLLKRGGSVTETQLQRAILDALNLLPGVYAFRVNSGRRGKVHLAPAGTSDILAVVAPHGRFCGLEVKLTGQKLNAAQVAFRDRVRELGAVAEVVDSVAAAVAAVNSARE
jgi:hypothetical protein